jgi:WD40 repeat protein
MRVYTPEINWHDIKPILSLDIHLSSGRLATAGADNSVRIWRLKWPQDNENKEEIIENLMNAAANGNEIPALLGGPEVEFLSSLELHEEPVNCVRFSPDGRYLASGSDDRLIHIWKAVEDDKETQHNQQENREMKDDKQAESGDGSNKQNEILVEDNPTPAHSSFTQTLPFGVERSEVFDQKEQWSKVKTLRSVGSELYDLSWSPDGFYLIEV